MWEDEQSYKESEKVRRRRQELGFCSGARRLALIFNLLAIEQEENGAYRSNLPRFLMIVGVNSARLYNGSATPM